MCSQWFRHPFWRHRPKAHRVYAWPKYPPRRGAPHPPSSPADFGKFIAEEIEKWGNHAGSEAEIDKVLSELDSQHVSALVIGGDPFFNSRREQIVALVARRAIPAIYEWREFTVAGGLMS